MKKDREKRIEEESNKKVWIEMIIQEKEKQFQKKKDKQQELELIIGRNRPGVEDFY